MSAWKDKIEKMVNEKENLDKITDDNFLKYVTERCESIGKEMLALEKEGREAENILKLVLCYKGDVEIPSEDAVENEKFYDMYCCNQQDKSKIHEMFICDTNTVYIGVDDNTKFTQHAVIYTTDERENEDMSIKKGVSIMVKSAGSKKTSFDMLNEDNYKDISKDDWFRIIEDAETCLEEYKKVFNPVIEAANGIKKEAEHLKETLENDTDWQKALKVYLEDMDYINTLDDINHYVTIRDYCVVPSCIQCNSDKLNITNTIRIDLDRFVPNSNPFSVWNYVKALNVYYRENQGYFMGKTDKCKTIPEIVGEYMSEYFDIIEDRVRETVDKAKEEVKKTNKHKAGDAR